MNVGHIFPGGFLLLRKADDDGPRSDLDLPEQASGLALTLSTYARQDLVAFLSAGPHELGGQACCEPVTC